MCLIGRVWQPEKALLDRFRLWRWLLSWSWERPLKESKIVMIHQSILLQCLVKIPVICCETKEPGSLMVPRQNMKSLPGSDTSWRGAMKDPGSFENFVFLWKTMNYTFLPVCSESSAGEYSISGNINKVEQKTRSLLHISVLSIWILKIFYLAGNMNRKIWYCCMIS